MTAANEETTVANEKIREANDDRRVRTGGCQCGAVRFSTLGPLGEASVCYCRMCQKATGGAFGLFVRVDSDRLTWTRGAPKYFVSSNVAKRGLPYRADYVCSKWALLGFNQTLALEMAPHNIRVNAVCPGPIEGDRIEDVMRRHAEVEKKTVAEIRRAWQEAAPMNRFIEPGEVVALTLFLSSEDASAMTGQAINVTGGFIMN